MSSVAKIVCLAVLVVGSVVLFALQRRPEIPRDALGANRRWWVRFFEMATRLVGLVVLVSAAIGIGDRGRISGAGVDVYVVGLVLVMGVCIVMPVYLQRVSPSGVPGSQPAGK